MTGLGSEDGEGLDGNVPEDPERRYTEEHGPYELGVNEDGRGGRGSEGSQPSRNEGIRKEGQREYREQVVPECVQGAAVQKLVQGSQCATAGAVVAGQAEEGTDRIVARFPGVEDIKHSGRAKGHEARDYIDGPLGESVSANRL